MSRALIWLDGLRPPHGDDSLCLCVLIGDASSVVMQLDWMQIPSSCSPTHQFFFSRFSFVQGVSDQRGTLLGRPPLGLALVGAPAPDYPGAPQEPTIHPFPLIGTKTYLNIINSVFERGLSPGTQAGLGPLNLDFLPLRRHHFLYTSSCPAGSGAVARVRPSC